MGTQLPLPKKGAQPPIFGPCLLWPNGWMDQHAPGMEVGHGPGHIVLDGDPAPSPLMKHSPPPNFRPMSVVAKRLDEHKIPLGMEVGLGPGHIVLDGNLLPFPKKGTQPPTIFGPCMLWPNGWMDQDATWYKDRPQPRPHCVIWGPSSPSHKGYSPKCLAHVCCGQTVAHLSYC